MLVTVQDELLVTVYMVEPEVNGTSIFDGVTRRVGVAPAWVTVTVIGVPDPFETLILATLWSRLVFSVKFAVSVPLPVPFGVTVHHV